MKFLSRSAYGKKHGVSREAVRLWLDAGVLKYHTVWNGVSNVKIIEEGEPSPITIKRNCPEGFVSPYKWASLNDRSPMALYNLIFTHQVKDVYRIPETRHFLVPKDFKYPTTTKGRKKTIKKKGYHTFVKWCRLNKYPLQKTLRENYFNPIDGVLLENGRLYVPIGTK